MQYLSLKSAIMEIHGIAEINFDYFTIDKSISSSWATKLLFQANNRNWRKGLVYKLSSIASNYMI